jgi:hypothetical protein
METRMAALMHDPNLRSSDLHMQGIDIKLSPLSTVQEDQEFLSPVPDLVPGLHKVHTFWSSKNVDASSHRIRPQFRIYSTIR